MIPVPWQEFWRAFGNFRRLPGNSGKVSGTPDGFPETRGSCRVKKPGKATDD
jgi:hypothetical protein